MTKSSNLTAIMLVQQLEEKYWLFSDYKTAIQQARDGNCQPLLEAVVKHLEVENIKVDEAYGIIHNKDTVTVWNVQEQKNVDETKEDHIHFLFKFAKGASLEKLALSIGVEPQYLEKLKSGRYGYDNCQAYLVHAKDESKYQYSADEVVTVLGEDYISLYNRKMESWIRGRAKKEAQDTNLSIDWIISEILAGKLSKNQILLTDEYYAIYGQHKRKINEALDTSSERKSYKTISELENGEFKKTVIFITADSGIGKTTISKQLIRILQKVSLKFGQNWDTCVTASTNAFDEYNGQDILFLDDIRGDSLTVSDWLKLLDPYMISPISARYHNKMGSAKVIIITSTKKPVSFFEASKGNIGEDLGQFIRRIDYLLTINDSFWLSLPIKSKKTDTTSSNPWYEPRYHSYCFSEVEQYTKNNALDHLVKTVIRNMQWNTTKKVINASDQTNNDNQNIQQK